MQRARRDWSRFSWILWMICLGVAAAVAYASQPPTRAANAREETLLTGLPIAGTQSAPVKSALVTVPSANSPSTSTHPGTGPKRKTTDGHWCRLAHNEGVPL